EKFHALRHRVLAYLQGRDLFVQDAWAGADPAWRLPIRVVAEDAWHALFARNMFLRPRGVEAGRRHEPRLTVVHVPRFRALPELDGTRSEVFVVLDLSAR